MDLKINDKLFLVGGATAGFGNAVARALIAEGAKVIAVARNAENLSNFTSQFPENIEAINGDITDSEIITEIVEYIGDRKLDGILVNAGGHLQHPHRRQTWRIGTWHIFRWCAGKLT